VREDPALVQALGTLELGQHVPPELYAAVAEALVWAYRLTGGRPPR
jgi:flagellar biosynthesis protein